MMVFCPEHPKWDQNPKFLPLSETPLCAESLPRAGVLNMSETDTEKNKFIYSLHSLCQRKFRIHLLSEHLFH